MKRDFTKISGQILAIVVVLLAVASFVLSFSATSAEACTRVTDGWLCYLFPFIIEFGFIAFLLWSLVRGWLGLNRAFPLTLTGAFVLLAATINVAHAKYVDGDALQNILTAVMASIPPITLFFASEALVDTLKSFVTRGQITGEITAAREQLRRLRAERQTVHDAIESQNKIKEGTEQRLEAMKAKLANGQAEIDEQLAQYHDEQKQKLTAQLAELQTAVSEAEQQQLSQLQTGLLLLAEANPEMSQADMGRTLGKSSSTVSQNVKQLTEAGFLSKNGHGWEVNNE